MSTTPLALTCRGSPSHAALSYRPNWNWPSSIWPPSSALYASSWMRPEELYSLVTVAVEVKVASALASSVLCVLSSEIFAQPRGISTSDTL